LKPNPTKGLTEPKCGVRRSADHTVNVPDFMGLWQQAEKTIFGMQIAFAYDTRHHSQKVPNFGGRRNRACRAPFGGACRSRRDQKTRVTPARGAVLPDGGQSLFARLIIGGGAAFTEPTI
jgi:hypothetical protein